jgi:GT2 family glycosyltransferase
MSFYNAFFRTLLWRPKQAIEALYWHTTGHGQRARNRLRLGAAQSSHAYQVWIATVERLQETTMAAARSIAGWPTHPRITVILFQEHSAQGAQFERCIAALSRQIYRNWELVLVQSYDIQPPLTIGVPRLVLAPSRATNHAQAMAVGAGSASGDYIMPLSVSAELAPTALFHLAEALQDDPCVELLYGDHDHIGKLHRRVRPWFKPRWNREMLLAQDYISQACMIRADAFRAAIPLHPAVAEAAGYAIALAVTAARDVRVVHVPRILAHLTQPPLTEGEAQSNRAAALSRAIADEGASIAPGPWGSLRVDWPLPADLPLVSIIIPTRDRVKLLRACLISVLGATRYPNYEIIVVDNGSVEKETASYLERAVQNPRVRVLRDDGPFNWSALNNRAAREARGDYLCLMNNDIEVLDEQWLTALMRQATRPCIGAAGAKLLYDDHRIQHAGVVVGLHDAAGHAHRFQRNAEAGYFAQAHIARYVTAVTGACMVVAKAKFEAVGGLDEATFAVAFNDVDLCLRLEHSGWRNVYVPQAVLIHHESQSHGSDTRPDQIARYQGEVEALRERWGTDVFLDPLHHPALERDSEAYIVKL